MADGTVFAPGRRFGRPDSVLPAIFGCAAARSPAARHAWSSRDDQALPPPEENQADTESKIGVPMLIRLLLGPPRSESESYEEAGGSPGE